jgi:ribosomal protein S18 acetylase RimI-like enzyme
MSAPLASSAAPVLPPWTLVPARADLLPQISALEAVSYASDEICTPENFAYRLKHAEPFFKVAVSSEAVADGQPPRVLGFVVGTLSVDRVLKHSAMFEHAPEGEYLCIHSVVTAPELRRRGLARQMLTQYTEAVRMEQGSKLKAIVLIAKKDLVPFYVSCGFVLQGPSDVVHGADPWFECRMDCTATRGADKA